MRRTAGVVAVGVCAIAIMASCKAAEDALDHVSVADLKMQLEKLDVPSSGFVQRAPPPTTRLPYVATHGGALYLIGGVDTSVKTVGTVEKYDPSANTWSTLAPWPNPRLTEQFFELGSQLCALGTDAINKDSTGDLDCYDTDKNTWAKRAAIPPDAGTGVFRSAVVDGKLYAFAANAAQDAGDAGAFDASGFDASSSESSDVSVPSDLWVYDPTADAWTKKTPSPVGCSRVGSFSGPGSTAMVGGSGVIYVMGCDGGKGSQAFAGPAFSYDIAKDQWTQLPWPAMTPTHAFFVTAANKIVVVSNLSPFVVGFDLNTHQWSATPDPLPAMVPFHWTVTADATTISFFDFSDGTDTAHSTYFGEVNRFDVPSNSWTQNVAKLPQYPDNSYAPDFAAVTLGTDEYIVGAWASATVTFH
jgi:hypothetical protein